MAAHDKHSPWSKEILHLKDQPGRAVCWRHPTDWRLDTKVDFLVYRFHKILLEASYDLYFHRVLLTGLTKSLLIEQHAVAQSEIEVSVSLPRAKCDCSKGN